MGLPNVISMALILIPLKKFQQTRNGSQLQWLFKVQCLANTVAV